MTSTDSPPTKVQESRDDSTIGEGDGYSRYRNLEGRESSDSILLPVSPPEAFDKWISHVWMNGGHGYAARKVVLEESGKGRGMLGCIRRLNGGIREKIVSVDVPLELGKGRNPSILYEMTGPFPVHSFFGFVQFILDESTGNTLLVWSIKFEPTAVGNLCCLGGSFIQMICSYGLSITMQAFKEYVHD